MVYNSNDIQKIIPHRYPFLLVDQIDSIGEDGTSIVGHKRRHLFCRCVRQRGWRSGRPRRDHVRAERRKISY